jgi:hypothetical protein
LKHFLVAAALVSFSIVVPNAHANSALFTFTPGQPNETWSSPGTNSGVLTLSFGNLGTVTMTAYSCPQTLCNSTPTQAESQISTGLTDNNGGVGLFSSGSTNNEVQVPRNDFVTVDFSNFKGVVQNVSFSMVDVVDGWDIYSTGVKNELSSTGNITAIAQANNGAGFSKTTFPTTSNSSISAPVAGLSTGTSTVVPTTSFLTVTALQADCEVEISSLNITYSTPEPTTLILMGGALLGLGLAGKKLRRRS